MDHFRKIHLPLTVFLTGACVLIIEIIAIRILSPYYGNTIFTVSSVIGIVLAALSVGYYFGGKLADKYPRKIFFYSIILISGISVFSLYLLTIFLLPSLGYSLSLTAGPIISAVILFFMPSLLLGMTSPFAVKLQGQYFPEKGIGSITGEIFFWSTVGSISGSLLAGFVIIPRFGINQIILAVAAVLVILGLLPFAKKEIRKKSIFKILLFIIMGIALAVTVSEFKDRDIVYSRDGVYEKIVIYDGEYAGQPARFLQQDRSVSGGIFLNSDQLVFDFSKYYALYKIFKPDVKYAFVIGGGPYSIPKALLKDLPDAIVDVAEIEPSLYELAQKYFNVSGTERLNNYTEDGRRLLYDTDKKYDLIFSDVYYSWFSIPAHFTTQEFFEIAKNKLSDEGIFIGNFVGDLLKRESSATMSEIKTFQSVFSNSYFFAVDSPDKIGLQNIIFVGYNSDKKMNFSESEFLRNENSIIRSLARKIVNLDEFDFSKYPILTDNFSPVEYLTAQMLKNNIGQ